MLAFMNHEYDVLVATTIIENGLDIPLANTIIINRADRHGLSELYQLRGRVGRSNRRAYSYLLIPPETELTEIARRRLAALKEFSDLGAGFKIAALDLELRGAGNMLGGEQSGHIEAIGFEMYTSMLEEAVRKMKGEEEKPAHAGTVINLGISVRIDSDYIPEENQRLRMYKRIAGAEDQRRPRRRPRRAARPLRHPTRIRPQPPRRRRNPPPLRTTRHRPARPQAHPDRTPQTHNGNTHASINPQAASKPSSRCSTSNSPPSTPSPTKLAHAAIDPAILMKLVSRNAKRGAQFTPQGTLRWPLPSAKAEDVLAETRALLDALESRSA